MMFLSRSVFFVCFHISCTFAFFSFITFWLCFSFSKVWLFTFLSLGVVHFYNRKESKNFRPFGSKRNCCFTTFLPPIVFVKSWKNVFLNKNNSKQLQNMAFKCNINNTTWYKMVSIGKKPVNLFTFFWGGECQWLNQICLNNSNSNYDLTSFIRSGWLLLQHVHNEAAFGDKNCIRYDVNSYHVIEVTNLVSFGN